VDFRKGAEGLALLAKETLGHDPMKGVAVVFRAKRADRVKIVGISSEVAPQNSPVGGMAISRRRDQHLRLLVAGPAIARGLDLNDDGMVKQAIEQCVATTKSPKISPHSAKPRFEVRVTAPFHIWR